MLARRELPDTLFSVMALAALTSSLFKELKTAEQIRAALDLQNAKRILSLGVPALDEALPQRGLAYGSVIELQVRGASGAATSLALCACRAAQNSKADWGEFHREAGRSSKPWCAFIDPSASLFAPGASELGIDLGRLLVVRPEMAAVERVAVRIAEAKVVSVLVVDLRGALGDSSMDERRWQRAVRRLSLVIKQLSTCVLLITRPQTRHALPLPVAMRLELNRLSGDNVEIRVAKERSGRISPPHIIAWSAFEEWRAGAAPTPSSGGQCWAV